MQHIDLFGFFSIGFFGGFGHCLGMCHPFVLYISGRFVGEQKGYVSLFKPHLMYNFGRLVTYSVMGMAIGFIGDMANFAGNMMGVQKVAAIVAGVFLILYGFLAFTGYNLINTLEQKFAAEKVMGIIKKFQPNSAFTSGLILGLLPCGLVYGALIACASLAHPIKGAVSMLIFGVGTMFAMMAASVFGNFIMKRRGFFNTVSLIVLIIMGAYFIYSGVKF